MSDEKLSVVNDIDRDRDRREALRRYGISPAGLSDGQVDWALQRAGQCNAWEVVAAVVHGMDYPVRPPDQVRPGSVRVPLTVRQLLGRLIEIVGENGSADALVLLPDGEPVVNVSNPADCGGETVYITDLKGGEGEE
jgi:hypothetical protein